MASKKKTAKKTTSARTTFKPMDPAAAKGWVAKYAKRHELSLADAHHKVLSLGITRQISLEKFGKKTGAAAPKKVKAAKAPKASKPVKTKTVKQAAAKVAKPKAAKKPAAARKPKTVKASAPAPVATES